MTFEEFWRLYPRKTAKLDAAREWARLKPNADTCVQIATTLAWQIPAWNERNEPAFIPHPRTWLHQGRWMDEPPVVLVKVADVWVCPHTEQCPHRAACEVKQAQPLKYPRRVTG